MHPTTWSIHTSKEPYPPTQKCSLFPLEFASMPFAYSHQMLLQFLLCIYSFHFEFTKHIRNARQKSILLLNKNIQNTHNPLPMVWYRIFVYHICVYNECSVWVGGLAFYGSIIRTRTIHFTIEKLLYFVYLFLFYFLYPVPQFTLASFLFHFFF